MSTVRDFDGFAQTLLDSRFFEKLLPGGKQVGKWWRCGDISGGEGGSFILNTETGYWEEKNDGTWGGDIIALYAEQNGISQGEAFKALADNSGFSSTNVTPIKSKPKAVAIMPQPYNGTDLVPEDFARYGVPDYLHIYPDSTGTKTLMVVGRHELGGGKKSFYPWTYLNGLWDDVGHPNPRPLYGLDLLARDPGKRVLIVEGELCADAAREVMGHIYVVISWSGGAGSVLNTDWTPLIGREILLWPDRDRHLVKNERQALKFRLNIGDEIPYQEQSGTKAMARLSDRLMEIGVTSLKVLNVEDQEDGHDVRVAIKDHGLSYKQIIAWAAARVDTIKEKPRPPDPDLKTIATSEENEPAGDLPSIDAIFETMPHRSKSGLRSTIENLEHLLAKMRIKIRYNVIKKTEELIIPDTSFSMDNRENASLAWIKSLCGQIGLPTKGIEEFLTFLADTTPYNPITTWIQSKPWDGISRLPDLYKTIMSTDEILKEKLIYRWLISAVAAAFNPQGVSAHGMLVLQGAQNLGKTSWFKNLIPSKLDASADGMILRPDDKDSVKQICSYWLVELGELDATFRKSDIAQLKAFITKDRDKLRAAYARKESEYARRTVFFGSVNPQKYLHDPSGSRRFWTIHCVKIDHKHGLDMQQIWAEIYEQHYLKGEKWFLSQEEIALLNNHNEAATVMDSIEEKIRTDLDWDNSKSTKMWRTATDVLAMIKYDKPSKSDTTTAGIVLSKILESDPEKIDRKSRITRYATPGLKT